MSTSAKMNHPAIGGQQHKKSMDKKIECFVQVLCTTPRYPWPHPVLEKNGNRKHGLLDTPSANANKSRSCEIQHLTLIADTP
jgi:hypothetical protein